MWLNRLIHIFLGLLFQSTHPRRVWLNTFRKNPYFSYVSIHTPTKGVTYIYCKGTTFSGVSIHTPTKGVTNNWCMAKFLMFVSIHTPTKGVTLCLHTDRVQFRFQSTHPRRVWHGIHRRQKRQKMFQSTHPRRVWHLVKSKAYSLFLFQSTHPRRVWHIFTNIIIP